MRYFTRSDLRELILQEPIMVCHQGESVGVIAFNDNGKLLFFNPSKHLEPFILSDEYSQEFWSPITDFDQESLPLILNNLVNIYFNIFQCKPDISKNIKSYLTNY